MAAPSAWYSGSMLFDIDDTEIRNLEKDLRTFAARAFPFAVRDALNRAVFGSQAEIRQELKRRMVLRNKWTQGSIRVDTAKGTRVERFAAAVGSVEEYMADQEEGFARKGRKHGVAIPTSYSAGQMGARPRTRRPRKANRMASIAITKHRLLGGNDKQRNVVSVLEAIKSGNRFVFLRFNSGRKGIFKVVGGNRRQGRGWPKGAKLRMVWDLSSRTVHTKAHKWLDPKVDDMVRKMPELYRRALKEQLRRQALLGA